MIRQDCSKEVLGTIFLMMIIPLILLILTFVFYKEIFMGIEIYINWYKDNVFLGLISYFMTFIILVPLMFPATPLLMIGGILFGKIYGKIAGFFVTYLMTIISYPLASLITFIIGRKYLRGII